MSRRKVLIRYWEKNLPCEGAQTVQQGPREVGDLHPGRQSTVDGTRCRATDQRPAQSGKLDQRPPEVPSHPSHTTVLCLTLVAEGNLGGECRFSSTVVRHSLRWWLILPPGTWQMSVLLPFQALNGSCARRRPLTATALPSCCSQSVTVPSAPVSAWKRALSPARF